MLASIVFILVVTQKFSKFVGLKWELWIDSLNERVTVILSLQLCIFSLELWNRKELTFIVDVGIPVHGIQNYRVPWYS